MSTSTEQKHSQLAGDKVEAANNNMSTAAGGSTTKRKSWQRALTEVITSREALYHFLDLPFPKNTDKPHHHNKNIKIHFPLRVPLSFAARMQKGNPYDPLLLQVLPQAAENKYFPGFCKDPLAEKNSSPVDGLLHKFKDRVLLILSGACAIHCRYCFRQHFPYKEQTLSVKRMQQVIHYLQSNPQIKEVILSGGDPLTIKDSQLRHYLQQLEKIPHLKRIRIHTRLPIVIPQRICDEFLETLQQCRLQKVIVMHCNHPQEINHEVIEATNRLRQIKQMTLLNQSVLLKNINDDAKTLAALSERLLQAHMIPYYLHRLDHVEGSAHFAVSIQKTRDIMWQLLAECPGYLVPKLVAEIPGMPSKMPIDLGPCPWTTNDVANASCKG